MRSRSLKPSFFQDYELASRPMAARVLFAGLWCMADRSGRLRDQPAAIKAAVFPYENQNVSRLLDELAKPKESGQGFITRYVASGVKYIQIHNFERHQNPHKQEKPSTIPSIIVGNPKPEALPVENGTGSEVAEKITEAVGLTPDSCNLTPDSGLLTAVTPTSVGHPIQSARPDVLMLIWNEVAAQANLPVCRALGTADRMRHATDRWREKPDPGYWHIVAERIAASEFCRGSKGWKATFDFFVEADTHVKVLEGQYDHAPPPNRGKTAGNIDAAKRFLAGELPSNAIVTPAEVIS